MKKHLSRTTRLSAATAATAAFLLAGSASGQDFSVSQPAMSGSEQRLSDLTQLESTVRIGAGYVSDDHQRAGMYSGLNDQGSELLLDIDLVRRDDATGTWLSLLGRNLGLDNRDLRFEHQRQGDWGYFLEFSQTPRVAPYTFNTRLLGVGSDSLTVNGAAAPYSLKLETEREQITLGGKKHFPGGFAVRASFRNEEKDGERLFGRGTSGAQEFLAEPIDSTTNQFELVADYTGQRLQLTGGYYGTRYDNHVPGLTIAGGSGAAPPLIALPPGNESHQAHLAGGYSFTPTTRGTFKVSYTHATQDERFITTPPAPNTRTHLGGEVDTTLVHLGLKSRPLPKLSVAASLRYEDRDDQTPVDQYIPLNPPTAGGLTGTASSDGKNVPHSRTSKLGKLEVSYQLPQGYRLTGGLDYDRRERSHPAVRSVSYRDHTEETAYFVELRRSLSETLNGALSYVESNRTGSDYLPNIRRNGVTPYSNVMDPVHWGDRDREKWRMQVDWQPLPLLSLQATYDNAKDRYDGRARGREKGKAELFSLDATYTFSDDWQATAWITRDDTRSKQSTTTTGGTATAWQARLRTLGEAVGIGLRGKPLERLELGADLQYSDDRSEYKTAAITGSLTPPAIPNINSTLASLRLFGEYALQKNAGVRLSLVRERLRTDDWTWTGWTYSDGTTVTRDPNDEFTFVGVSLYYKWR